MGYASKENEEIMSKFKIHYPTGATPLDLDEIKDLIPDYISTEGELNQLEQANITDAIVWVGKQSLDDLLSVSFTLKLHKNMFDQVWRWAGQVRRSNKNIGVMKEQILDSLDQLLKNTQWWIENNTYPIDEIAIRFHHRLVQIHVFSNGNGRHSRLMTDLLLEKNKAQKFSWGSLKSSSSLDVEGERRAEYIAALKKADQSKFDDLMKFVRS